MFIEVELVKEHFNPRIYNKTERHIVYFILDYDSFVGYLEYSDDFGTYILSLPKYLFDADVHGTLPLYMFDNVITYDRMKKLIEFNKERFKHLLFPFEN